jgi:hypothetical protein
MEKRNERGTCTKQKQATVVYIHKQEGRRHNIGPTNQEASFISVIATSIQDVALQVEKESASDGNTGFVTDLKPR